MLGGQGGVGGGGGGGEGGGGGGEAARLKSLRDELHMARQEAEESRQEAEEASRKYHELEQENKDLRDQLVHDEQPAEVVVYEDNEALVRSELHHREKHRFVLSLIVYNQSKSGASFLQEAESVAKMTLSTEGCNELFQQIPDFDVALYYALRPEAEGNTPGLLSPVGKLLEDYIKYMKHISKPENHLVKRLGEHVLELFGYDIGTAEDLYANQIFLALMEDLHPEVITQTNNRFYHRRGRDLLQTIAVFKKPHRIGKFFGESWEPEVRVLVDDDRNDEVGDVCGGGGGGHLKLVLERLRDKQKYAELLERLRVKDEEKASLREERDNALQKVDELEQDYSQLVRENTELRVDNNHLKHTIRVIKGPLHPACVRNNYDV